MFITDDQLLDALANRLHTAVSALPSFWTGIVGDSNTAAYNEIVGRLMARGFLKADIDQWDRGAEFQRRVGVWFMLRDGGAYAGFDAETIKSMDCRKDLDTTLFAVSGAWVKPSGDEPGLATTGGPLATGGIFNFPNPDDPDLGEYTRF